MREHAADPDPAEGDASKDRPASRVIGSGNPARSETDASDIRSDDDARTETCGRTTGQIPAKRTSSARAHHTPRGRSTRSPVYIPSTVTRPPAGPR
jgi:hypothetical protein